MAGSSRAQKASITLVFTFALGAAACGPPQPRPLDSAPPASASAVVDPALAEYGVLQVFVTDQLTDGRNIKIRGLIRNPYDEAVEGVRLVLRILTIPGPEGRELDRFQRVLDTRIGPGEQTALRFDAQTMYAGQGGFTGFTLLAFGIRRGAHELPMPPQWRE